MRNKERSKDERNKIGKHRGNEEKQIPIPATLLSMKKKQKMYIIRFLE